jgi:hypothetical protein
MFIIIDNDNLTSQSQASDESFEYVQSFSSLHGKYSIILYLLRYSIELIFYTLLYLVDWNKVLNNN